MRTVILPDFATACPHYRTIVIEATVSNSPTSDIQKEEMARMAADIAARYAVPDINRIPAIAATRAAYKACGKDPNRYRPSQEQLMRRIVRGLGLYHVDAVVDAGNQLSLLTGCPLGCFDLTKIRGEQITLGIGREGEPYEGIGRGPLNIAGMPLFRDDAGGFGTPTSDNERTKIAPDTKSLLVTIHLFDPQIDPQEVLARFRDIFSRFCSLSDFSYSLISAKQTPQ